MENGVEGKGHNGGIWEWTSTVFDGHEGYLQSELYPGYVYSFMKHISGRLSDNY
jgi:formylglycine-generating enzyme required for sulfatase activity